MKTPPEGGVLRSITSFGEHANRTGVDHQTAIDRPPRLSFLNWYTGDFASSTRDWPLIARGIYRELLDAAWDLGSLPNDETLLRSMVRASSTEWVKGWPTVAPKWVVGADGRLRNLRLEEHRAEAIARFEKRRDASNKRWHKSSQPITTLGGA